jgi:hypothetical protein
MTAPAPLSSMILRVLIADMVHAPLACKTAAQIAVSVVMKRTLRSGPPKVKLTAPGRLISPIRSPATSKT